MRLTLPADVGFLGVNPNRARSGSFSPSLSRDRLALVANSAAASVLMTARVNRDVSTLKITGLSDLVVVGDLYSLGVPDPTVPADKGFTGDVDYSPDGSRIVASIYFDLWLVHLTSENTNAGADLLTANTDGFASGNPRTRRKALVSPTPPVRFQPLRVECRRRRRTSIRWPWTRVP